MPLFSSTKVDNVQNKSCAEIKSYIDRKIKQGYTRIIQVYHDTSVFDGKEQAYFDQRVIDSELWVTSTYKLPESTNNIYSTPDEIYKHLKSSKCAQEEHEAYKQTPEYAAEQQASKVRRAENSRIREEAAVTRRAEAESQALIKKAEAETRELDNCIKKLEEKGYTVTPPAAGGRRRNKKYNKTRGRKYTKRKDTRKRR